MKSSYDCVVIGAGPGGGAAAATVAAGGLSTLLVERESVPRFHVGESLMPETYWPLQRLGLTERVQAAGWQMKQIVQFVSHKGMESAPFFFKMHDDRPSSNTWQVERSEFDKMLYDRAAECGAECVDQTRVLDVRFDQNNRATGVVVRERNGDTTEIDCKVVIDASGQQSMLSSKLGLKEVNPNLKKAAIWGYYRGAVRGEGNNDGATIIMNTSNRKSWFWFIPMSRGITSIGCVANNDYLLKGRGTPEQTYEEELAMCPGMTPRLMEATRVGDLKAAKEFSYSSSAPAGDGWVLVGDAYGFIDPVYSSGVYFALEMGVRAGDAVVEGFEKNDLGGEQLGSWSESFNEGAQWIRKLVQAFYTEEFSIGRFMKEHPEHRSCLTDVLIGRIFKDGAKKMFEDMEASIEKVKMEKAS